MSRILDMVRDEQSRQVLRHLNEERAHWLEWKPFQAIREKMALLPDLAADHVDFDDGAIVIGRDLPLEDRERQTILEACQAILPWKKGPYRLFGIELDAEWRSDHKWDRMKHRLPSFKDQVILDIGGNNGYYAFRMLADEPSYVLNIDPVPRLWYQFHLLQHFARRPELEFQMWGWEEVAHFEKLFDSVFCMGILYHHFNPIQILKNIHQALKPGGLLVLESIVIPGEEAYCLFPEDRYARMRNVWFVPTVSAMRHMLARCKFEDIEVVAVNRHEAREQRTTVWNPGQSYADFVDATNPDRTVEGLAAPHRAILFARRKKRQ
ncbi:tRNA 5-methoxyuridine(34)/uridine 5-oxyacetic acid(34) synthase CmoB [Sulfidibacter corallicola]|uniref:tRNA 5-methoxyuridine(34)/uridine 5-oxyacetic acid(34) synthase CmoB n=1 Tax=Sulfidibacter corallicola TaxID=2818388 RepID=A0A8A4TDX4_SULCO|nr:tRNA 5-methoxyuridine(34)/uridine 5-oxyacetic acid(34) synthase CmoB [Sulfidibacter corallicola]QTD48136.1 tRNA 5-methoxyuridine(34)/uridine 5-oxyacetic acid(34) synthase CmoB [Sulfidibacter corallicola]